VVLRGHPRLSEAITHPFSVISSWPLKSCVFGMWPIATKAASAGISVTLVSSVVERTATLPSTFEPSTALNSATVEFHMTVILGLLSTAFASTLDARKESRL
jgi:hypothetical protein